MIAQGTVNGKKAIVAFLKDAEGGGFDTVEPGAAEVIKVMYEGGDVEFYEPQGWAKQKVQLEEEAKSDEEPSEEEQPE